MSWDTEILGSMPTMVPISTNEIADKIQDYHIGMLRSTLITKIDFKLRLFRKYGMVDTPGLSSRGRLWVKIR